MISKPTRSSPSAAPAADAMTHAVQTLARLGRVEAHGIAVSPGETAAFGFVGERPVLLIPGAPRCRVGGVVFDRAPSRRKTRRRQRRASIGAAAAQAQSHLDDRAYRIGPGGLRGRHGGAARSGYLSFTALTRSDGWIVVPADSEGFAAGTPVAVNRGPEQQHGHKPETDSAGAAILDAVRRAARQEQFLEVVSAPEARRRFEACVDRSPLAGDVLPLAAALGRVLAADVIAPVDAPPFDRSNVDGFAVRAADTVGASDGAPKRLTLNAEVIACGVAPAIEVAPGTATAIATGGVIPRGADAVVMIEQTELIEDAARRRSNLRRAAASGQFVSYAGSDIARGETLLRRGTQIGSREIGMLAACGFAAVDVVRRPRVAVLSTGDELVEPGRPLRPGGVYDSNGAIIAAAIVEAGGEPVPFGAFPDEEVALELAMRSALDILRHGRALAAARRRARATCRIASCRGSASPAFSCMAWRSSPASRFASRLSATSR